jgi:hypothetical protein
MRCLCVWFHFRVATQEARACAAKQKQTMRFEAPFRTEVVRYKYLLMSVQKLQDFKVHSRGFHYELHQGVTLCCKS